MPNSETHIAASIAAAPIVFVLVMVLDRIETAMTASVASLIAEVFLSPDLDHNVGCSAYRRWWLLRWIWIPYQRLVPHRSFLSHWPIFGTLGRLIVLTISFGVIAVGLAFLGIDAVGYLKLDRIPVEYAVAAVVGVELSAWVHYIADKLL